MAAPQLPTGTVTFLFTDIEGSTRLLDELGAERYAAALADHRSIVRDAVAAHGGVEVDTQGDAFFAAFAEAPAALAAAADMQEQLAGGPTGIRIGIHTGTGLVTDGGYVGMDVHRAARIAAAAHGGQVVVSASTAALAREAPLVDLGEHRFKDLAAAERVFQVGPRDFPPLRTLGRNNLPVPATPFLGRVAELGQASELARRPDVRVVTFTGPGGTGKTRLALQVAAEVSDDKPDGAYWVPLAAVRDPAVAVSAVGEALDVPRGGPSYEEDIVAALEGKRAIVLLDNVEQLLPGIASMIARLVSVAGPTVLATSRERLQLQQEHLFPVPSLSERDADELFVARARQLDPGFVPTAAVAGVCRRLDDLPLALELAAARTQLFSPEQLLDRLGDRLDLLHGGRDADPRQLTMRATMEWSHDLLVEAEQRLFARLTVFAGSCAFETAEAVCDADAETLQGLLDKSFLRRRDTGTGPRFWMLGTIREYGAERLAASGEAEAVRERHARWCAALVEQIPRDDLGAGFELARSAVVGERGEIAAALAWARESGREELFLQLGSGIGSLWGSAFIDAAPGWLDQAERVLPRAPAPLRAAALRNCASIAFFVLADTPRAVELWNRALEEAVAIGDDPLAAVIRYRLAMVAWEQGDPAEAALFLEPTLDEARLSGDRVRQVVALHHLGEVLRDLGEFDRGETLLRESLVISEAIGDLEMADNTIHSLGDLELDRGRLGEAADYYKQSLLFSLERANPRSTVYALAGIACVVAGRGDADTAAVLWAAVESAQVAGGFRMLGNERSRYAERLDPLKATPAWPVEAPVIDDAARLALAAID